MLDYLVLYQSDSGNTKKIAASIFSRLPGNSKDLIDIDTDKRIPEAKIYYKDIAGRVSAWIESDNEYLGYFICQGKMPQKVRMKYESMRTPENTAQIDRCVRNFDLALTHPDSLDVEHAKVFVDHMLKKIEL